MKHLVLLLLAACSANAPHLSSADSTLGSPWTMTQLIAPNGTNRVGADGAKILGDHVCTPWEQGTAVTVYDFVTSTFVTKTHLGAEDCQEIDVDGDGLLDVVDASEGQVDIKISGDGWSLVLSHGAVPSMPKQKYMQLAWVDGLLFAGGKTGSTGVVGRLGYFTISGSARFAASWTWHDLGAIGWTMALTPRDLDGDGDLDVLYSDREDPGHDIGECEQLAPGQYQCGELIHVGGDVAFADAADFDGDGLIDLAGGNRGALYTYTNDGNGGYDASANLKPAGTGDLHGVLFCDLGAGAQIVTTYALTDPGDSWVGVVDPATGAYEDVSGPADVIRKPDQGACYGAAIVVPEGGNKTGDPATLEDDLGLVEFSPQ